MNLNEYQESALTTRLPSYGPEAAVLGLFSEAGEVAGVFQKMIRGDFGLEETLDRLKKELGDVLWHIAAVAKDNNWELGDIAALNLSKLADRQLRQVLTGDGDAR